MRIRNSLARSVILSGFIVLLLMAGIFVSVPSAQVATAGGDGVRIRRSDTQGVVLELEVPACVVEIVKVEGQTYQRFFIEGYGSSSVPGEPELPQRGLLLGIPADAEIELKLLDVQSTIAGGYNIYPVPERSIEPLDPGRELLDEVPDFQVRFVKTQSIYATDTFFPSTVAEIGDSGYLRDQRYVQVLIHPVQYNPVTGELKHYHYIELQVSFNYPQRFLSLTPSRTESPAFETVLKNSILNYGIAKAWRARPRPQIQATSALLDYLSEPSYKIAVAQDGIYQLTYSDLLNAGVPQDELDELDPVTFQLFNMGSEVAIYVKGEGDRSFDPGDPGDPDDYILFYGQKMDTKYTDTNVYWLTYGKTVGLRMGTKDGTPSGASSPTSFEANVRLEEDRQYRSYLPMEEGADHWYWHYIPDSYDGDGNGDVYSAEYPFVLNNISTEMPTATLHINLMGFSYGNHHTKVYINGNLVEDALWSGRVERESDVSFPHLYLEEGSNVIKVEQPNDLGGELDQVFVNWFELDYYDTYTAEGDFLYFSGVVTDTITTWEYHVNGFTTNNVEVFDIFDITEPAATTKIVSPTVESYTLKFEDTITTGREYLALTNAQRLSPLSIVLDTPSDLHSTINGADYIIITHSDFAVHLPGDRDDIYDLESHRQSQGPRTMVVDVQDVYDEFRYGIFDPQAIHDFLAYAYAPGNWQAPAPSYVLLVGDGNFDFKDNRGTGEPNYIPPYLAMVDPTLGERATDNRYACVSGDDILADMHIGRLPAQTSTQASAIVNKILSYEQTASGDWNSKVLLVADDQPDPQGAGNFWDLSDDIANNYLPSAYAPPQKIYYSPGNPPYSTPGNVRTAIINAINEGRLLVNYIGHGAIQWWAHEFLRVNDIASLSNDQELPMMLPMTCYEGYFDYPNFPGLGESIVRAEGKGAIASWSPTGLGLAAGHHYLNQGFFTAVFTDNIAEIGTATYLGKLKLYTETGGEASPYRDLMDTYVLFGDPFMKLNLPACDAADYDNDGRITVADVMQVAAHWDTEWGDANFDRKYDLDDDGDVDIVDVMWVAGRWEEVC